MKLNLSSKTIHWLRLNNYKVKVFHSRHVMVDHKEFTPFVPIRDIPDMSKVMGKGGLTEVFVTTPDKKEYKGVAKCNMRDNFQYRLGTKIALGRLELIKT